MTIWSVRSIFDTYLGTPQVLWRAALCCLSIQAPTTRQSSMIPQQKQASLWALHYTHGVTCMVCTCWPFPHYWTESVVTPCDAANMLYVDALQSWICRSASDVLWLTSAHLGMICGDVSPGGIWQRERCGCQCDSHLDTLVYHPDPRCCRARSPAKHLQQVRQDASVVCERESRRKTDHRGKLCHWNCPSSLLVGCSTKHSSRK